MKSYQNQILKRENKKPVLYDIYHPGDEKTAPLVIFCHGYKGFKDWGAWHLVARAFALNGFCFVKFNFSHNGGTMEQPIDFPDLEAFGQNNYSKELEDLKDITDHIQNTYTNLAHSQNITVIGHSRGGGIVTLYGAEDTRITHIVSWAGVSDFKKRFPDGDLFDTWREKGVSYIINARTQQQMPHYFQFWEDFAANETRLTISRAAAELIHKNHLIVHGTADTSVTFDEAENLHRWNPKSELYILEGADHVFGARHPWDEDTLPPFLKDTVQKTIDFIKQEASRSK